jgi:hypothetical protein
MSLTDQYRWDLRYILPLALLRMINMLMRTSEADLRTEIALLRAQMGRQSNELHRPESNASQVCTIPAIFMATMNMLTLTSEADLRTETASFGRAQTGRQSYPVSMGSQVFITTSSVTHDKYADAYLRG